MTTVNVATMNRMLEIRADLALLGADLPTNALELIGKVVAHVGDPGVAVDALLLRARPAWLTELVGDALSVTG